MPSFSSAPLDVPKPSRWRPLLGYIFPPVRDLFADRMAYAWIFGSVILLRLCAPPLNFWPLGFVCLVPWFQALRRKTPRVAFWLSWIFGTFHFLTIFSWLTSLDRFNPAIYLGIPLLAIFQGFFIALGGWGIVSFAKRLSPWPALLAAGAWWAGWEWFRSVGALAAPFALLGHTVRGHLPLAQIVSIGGIPLLSALVLVVNLSLMEFITAASRKLLDAWVISRAVACIGLVIVASMWGKHTMAAIDEEARKGVDLRVALLQPNVDQEDKFASYAASTWEEQKAFQDRFTLQLFGMIDAIKPGTVDLIVLPESAFTQFLFDHDVDLQRELEERAREQNATIIAGANDMTFVKPDGEFTEHQFEADVSTGVPDYEMYGGLYVFKPDDDRLRLQADYHKIHLMPFGECVPYFDMIPGLVENVVQIGTFLRGDKVQPPIWIPVDATPDNPVDGETLIHLGPSICFEDMFAYLQGRLARRGAQVFVNITNNAWFDPSLGSEYHFSYARLRSIEARRPLVMATNTGVTAVIDGAGREKARLPKMTEETLIASVRVPSKPSLTIYSRFGDWFGWVSWIGTLALMGWFIKRGGVED